MGKHLLTYDQRQEFHTALAEYAMAEDKSKKPDGLKPILDFIKDAEGIDRAVLMKDAEGMGKAVVMNILDAAKESKRWAVVHGFYLQGMDGINPPSPICWVVNMDRGHLELSKEALSVSLFLHELGLPLHIDLAQAPSRVMWWRLITKF